MSETDAMRDAIDAGIRSFVSDQPDFDMSPGMRLKLIEHIMAQPGMFPPPPPRLVRGAIQQGETE